MFRRARAILPSLLVLVILAGAILPAVRAQTAFGATLTVLRGTVGVLRADGTPVSPAPNGLALATGDQVATVGRSSALITFFEGSEVELGADTTLIIRDMGQVEGKTTVGIQSVVGTTVNRVVAVTTAGSSYRIEAGGTVALVRGTIFAHHVDPAGDITVAVGEGVVEYPAEGLTLTAGLKRTLTSRGDTVDSRFDPTTPLINTVTEPVSSGNPFGTDNPGIGTGSFTAPQGQVPNREPDLPPPPAPPSPEPPGSPGHTTLLSAVPSGSTRLDVASTTGFAVGDVIRISDTNNAETGVIVGFGSIVLQDPLANSYKAGASVDVVGRVTPTGTPTPTSTATPVPTVTLTQTSTPVPSPTSSATPTPTGTATRTPTPTATPTSSATATVTPTSTRTPTPTPRACNTTNESGGTGVTTNVHELGRTDGAFQFTYTAFTITDKFEIFYEGNPLLDTGFVSGTRTQTVTYNGSSTQVTVRVTGNANTGTRWEYTIGCPIPPS